MREEKLRNMKFIDIYWQLFVKMWWCKLADDNLLLGCCFRLVNFVLPLKKNKNSLLSSLIIIIIITIIIIIIITIIIFLNQEKKERTVK